MCAYFFHKVMCFNEHGTKCNVYYIQHGCVLQYDLVPCGTKKITCCKVRGVNMHDFTLVRVLQAC